MILVDKELVYKNTDGLLQKIQFLNREKNYQLSDVVVVLEISNHFLYTFFDELGFEFASFLIEDNKIIEEFNQEIEYTCPLGGDLSNDCADCVYSGDYHFDEDLEKCVGRG